MPPMTEAPPSRFRRIRRLIRWTALPCLAYLGAATAFESWRTRDPLPRGAARPAELDPAALHADLVALADPGLEGRRTATPGGRKARDLVAQRFAELGLIPLPGGELARPFSFRHRSLRALWRRDRPFEITVQGAANVVGVRKGSDPAAGALLLGAHHDHLGVREGVLHPGADDDASGVAALFAVAAWVQPHPLRHDLIVAAFDAEEMGLRGSRALLADPGLPRDRLKAVLNLDMVGRSDAGGLTITGTWRNPQFRPLVEQAAARAAIPVFLRHDRPLWLGGFVQDWTDASDHGPFAQAGIPWLYAGVEDHADYHGPGDTAAKIDPAFHAAAVEIVLDLVRLLDAR